MSAPSDDTVFDVAVIGAGFGGLGAALRLAEGGARVVVLEALRYPGGCASTFERDGYRFETGATLFSGLADGQLFHQWIERYGLEVDVQLLEHPIEQRTPYGTLDVVGDKDAFIDDLARQMPEQEAELRAFFELQGKASDALWGLFDDPALLPPFKASALLAHLMRSPRYASFARHIGQPLGKVLKRFGLDGPSPFRLWLDATSQITLQCSALEAETPFALASVDYAFRGAAHVQGGIGRLAEAMCAAIEQAGGEVRLARRVKAVRDAGEGYALEVTKDGTLHAGSVVANVLPQALGALLVGPAPAVLDDKAKRLEDGWGAAMRYRVVRAPEGASPEPHHLQLIDDAEAPLLEGNHAFVSISGEGEDRGAAPGMRTLTVSTHVRARALREAQDPAAFIDDVQRRLAATLHKRAPEWESELIYDATASPRTWERFTSRPEGLVGGVPRTSGLAHYRGMLPRPVRPHLYLVGDSVFPGQSTLATALGGVKIAERVLADA
jgi:phytoene dehydrogenase-like protein